VLTLTPRGLDACRRRGIKQSDFANKTKTEIISMIK